MERAFVNKFNVINTFADLENPLSVGNGDFAFTCDITGLQTFYEEYNFIPLCSMSDLVWAERDVASPKPYKSYTRASDGREIKYMSDTHSPHYGEHRLNAYKFDLFKLAFTYNGKKLQLNEVSGICQALDVYRGEIVSRFTYLGEQVRVKTFIPQKHNNLRIEVETGLKGLEISLSFRTPSPELSGGGLPDNDYKITDFGVERKGADYDYKLYIKSNMPRTALVFDAGRGGFLSISLDGDFESDCGMCEYFDRAVKINCADTEINRRYVLSLYLLKVNSLGKYPPAETGLTCNSWYGKFHLEMHLWHVLGAIKAGLYEYALPALKWYLTIAQSAKERASFQGYKGMRPPKMTSPDGEDSPSNIGCFLIWQIPHLFVMLDEVYRQDKTALNFKDFASLLCGFADFLADFWYLEDGEYHLDSPLIPANENVEKDRDTPIFEICYTLHAFRLFKVWAQRLKIEYDFTRIDDILLRHVKPTIKDGAYETFNGCDCTYTKYNTDHPMTIGGYSFFKSEALEAQTVKNSLNKILESWQFDTSWGWDFPMLAMAANSVGEGGLALRILKMPAPKNTYLRNGHNPQGTRKDLPVYLPGNGAFVLAATDIFGKLNMQENKKLPVAIGVAGHRNIVEEDKPLIKSQVEKSLREIIALCKGAPVVMLNGLAQGADMLCAEVAFELGIDVYAVLPCEQEEYIKSFDNEADRAKLFGYVARCKRKLIAPDTEKNKAWFRLNADMDDDSYTYRQVGIYIAEHSRLLIALWDGKPPKTEYGCGTAEVIDFTLKGNDKLRSKSVIWIKSRRQGDGDNADIQRKWLTCKQAEGCAVYRGYCVTDGIPQFVKESLTDGV